MADVEEKKGAVGGRSPAYPFIPLDKALARAEALRKAIGSKADTRVISAMGHWGYGEKSSGGIQTAAALKHFGLIDDSGSGKERRIKLSELALRILLDQRPDSQERKQLVQRAALLPKMHQELWERWGRDLPVDAELRHYLLLDRGFNENGAEDLIKEYKATISYAGLLDSDSVPPNQEDISAMDAAPEPKRPPLMGKDFVEMFTPRQPPPAMMFAGGGDAVPISDNQIKVTMDGDRLQVVANVDAKGARKLLKAIQANLALLSDDDDEEAAN
ncbi:hypothetical protein [Bradyrhizobium sp. CCBAU 51627]|uniref:hypothetical protein n=1 Tax=Bradyrhizobium sp. CCBAU 51627 TaxID=1325088 RepID=UPI002305348D|nr:hypothetical protein [Bradyrhizobium sp. CCBAU 51627]MDA9435190.1 hypothetical protein [Bradyrhizobium sp. CCBAU 51627]